MSETVHFLSRIQESVRQNWNAPSMSYLKGETFAYKDVARRIAQLHILFNKSGIQPGDKMAICGPNSPEWGIAFLAICGYGAVAVPILNDFKPESIVNIVTHSDAKILFVGQSNWKKLDAKMFPNLSGIVQLESNELIVSNDEKMSATYQALGSLFVAQYAKFSPTDFSLKCDNLDELAIINYTSGTTSAPKGVMLSHRNISSNIDYALSHMRHGPGWHLLSMLPMAHMYGMAFEFLFQISAGSHVFFLNKVPSPQVILNAFAEVKPYLVITVPLVIEKIFKKSIFPIVSTRTMKFLFKVPIVNKIILRKIRAKLLSAFGGNMGDLVIGGAPLNQEVENLLKKMHFPYTIGYGMTECAPLLCYEKHRTFKKKSCGRPVDKMELVIDSSDPHTVVGEILAKGENVMMGYYKNPEATAATIDSDGWLHTGDLGLIDKDNFIFIKGRSKNMILGASGQNIYPEEIEDKLNNMPYVVESLVVERNGKLIGLVFPDYEKAQLDGLNLDQLQEVMNDVRNILNKMLPSYCPIAAIELREEEFDKTPKRSIRRFLYK